MNSWLAASASVICFVWLFWLMRLSDRGREVVTLVRSSMLTMRDAALDEIAKEKAIQASSLRLMRLFLHIVTGCLVCLTLPVVLVFALDVFGLVVFDDVLTRLVSLPFLVIGGVVGVVFMLVLERMGRARSG